MQTLTILGGGSAYTPGLLHTLITHANELPLEKVRLFDTNFDQLAIVARLALAMAEHTGAFKVEIANTLESAIAGADLVLNATWPGGLAASRIDETLPLEFDIPGQETIGPGGFFFALRSVPEALQVAATMQSLAPNAILLNYTNPSSIVTQALVDHGGIKVIGLCDQSDQDLLAICQALGQPKRYAFGCNGLNHATWYSRILIDGAPFGSQAQPLPAPEGCDEEHKLRFDLSVAMAREHPGYWPNSYLPYYFFPNAFVAQARRAPPRSDLVAVSLDNDYAHFESEGNRNRPQPRLSHNATAFGNLVVNVIRALASDTPHELVLNLPNHGTTATFAHDSVIETHVRVSSSGIERLAAPQLPTFFYGLAKRLERYQRLTARAAAFGDHQSRVAALGANPLVRQVLLAARILNRAEDVYGSLLPQAH